MFMVQSLWFEARRSNILLALGLCLGSSFGVAATKPNLILITLDSTRADRMGFLGAKARNHAESRSPGRRKPGLRARLRASARDRGLARDHPFRSLSADHRDE